MAKAPARARLRASSTIAKARSRASSATSASAPRNSHASRYQAALDLTGARICAHLRHRFVPLAGIPHHRRQLEGEPCIVRLKGRCTLQGFHRSAEVAAAECPVGGDLVEPRRAAHLRNIQQHRIVDLRCQPIVGAASEPRRRALDVAQRPMRHRQLVGQLPRLRLQFDRAGQEAEGHAMVPAGTGHVRERRQHQRGVAVEAQCLVQRRLRTCQIATQQERNPEAIPGGHVAGRRRGHQAEVLGRSFDLPELGQGDAEKVAPAHGLRFGERLHICVARQEAQPVRVVKHPEVPPCGGPRRGIGRVRRHAFGLVARLSQGRCQGRRQVGQLARLGHRNDLHRHDQGGRDRGQVACTARLREHSALLLSPSGNNTEYDRPQVQSHGAGPTRRLL